MLLQGIPGNPVSTSLSDSQPTSVMFGKSGDVLASAIHDTFYTAARRGGVFHASTAAAGVTIPVSSATAATFLVYNPIGSGVNAEIFEVAIGHTNATLVVAGIGFGIDFNLTVGPTGLTKITPYSGMLGSNAAPQVIAASIATVTATTRFHWLGLGFTATSGGPGVTMIAQPRGLILPPGSLAHVVSSAAQTQASDVRVSWAEWAASP